MKKNKKERNIRQGSMTVEAAFLVPMAVCLSALLIFYCFYEHDRVWYTAAACEAALAGTKRTEAGADTESLARQRAQQRMEEQPFPVSDPSMWVSTEKRSCSVSYESSGETAFTECFPYKTKETIRQTDPVGWVRTAWIARTIMNGG